MTGAGITTSASAPEARASCNAISRPAASRTSREWTLIPKACAERSASFRSSTDSELSGLKSKATADTLGTISFNSSRRLPLKSGVICDKPVTFPPGRARLVTSPVATGSPAATITTGMSAATFLAACVSAVTVVTMISTFCRTRSSARSGSRSSLPSAYRRSITRFLPSTHPASRSPSSNAFSHRWVFAAENGDRSPIRRTFAACWASASRAQTPDPIARTMNSRRFMLVSKTPATLIPPLLPAAPRAARRCGIWFRCPACFPG